MVKLWRQGVHRETEATFEKPSSAPCRDRTRDARRDRDAVIAVGVGRGVAARWAAEVDRLIRHVWLTRQVARQGDRVGSDRGQSQRQARRRRREVRRGDVGEPIIRLGCDRAQAGTRDRDAVFAGGVGRGRGAARDRAADVDGLVSVVRLAGELARERDVVRRIDRQNGSWSRSGGGGGPVSRGDVRETVIGLRRNRTRRTRLDGKAIVAIAVGRGAGAMTTPPKSIC